MYTFLEARLQNATGPDYADPQLKRRSERVCMDIPPEVEDLQKLERIGMHLGYRHRRKIVEEFCSNFNPDTALENEQLAEKKFKEIFSKLDSNN